MEFCFKNASIIDGTGKPAYVGDVGVSGGKIVMDPKGEADRIIDASGRVLSPGFIDFHSHGDAVMGKDYGNLCKVSQGITTHLGGECGISCFPVNTDKNHVAELKNALSVACLEFDDEFTSWNDLDAYGRTFEKRENALNLLTLTGHSNLRIAVMGTENRKPTADELEQMKELLRISMEQGSMGLSSGLIYSPSCFADTEELIELCKVISDYGGIYATHMRNESGDVCRSVEEAIRIGREANVAVSISHHKICGRKNWGLSEKTIALVAEARASGLEITVDQYPYLASMTHFKMCVPPWHYAEGPEQLIALLSAQETRKAIKEEILSPDTEFENQYLNCGGWENIIISSLPNTPEFNGITVEEAAKKMDMDPFDAYFELLIKNGTCGNAIYTSMCDDDLLRIIKAPDTVVGTDGICRTMVETGHPRAWGSFPHAICYFCKEKKVLTLEQMIHKITQLPAQRLRLCTKGVIADGFDADMVLFDYEQLLDRADYIHSNVTSRGIDVVMVGGKIVYENGELTGEYPGKFIRNNNP